MKSKLQKKIEERLDEIKACAAQIHADRKHYCDNLIAAFGDEMQSAKYIEQLKDLVQKELQNDIRFYELKHLLE